jgi:hypothetical protein
VGEEHPRLGRVDPDVVEDGVELRADELGRQLVHGGDAEGVLRGERDDDARPVAARRPERLEVGLDACAAPGVRAGDGQTTWNDVTVLPSPVLTGSGSTGVISARAGTPVEEG